jgi:hypothetical protein
MYHQALMPKFHAFICIKIATGICKKQFYFLEIGTANSDKNPFCPVLNFPQVKEYEFQGVKKKKYKNYPNEGGKFFFSRHSSSNPVSKGGSTQKEK